MPNKSFKFFPEDHPYEKIEEFCLSKGYLIEKDVHNNENYPLGMRNESRDGRLEFTINKFVSIRAPIFENQPESTFHMGHLFGELRDRVTRLSVAVRGDKDLTKGEALEEAETELAFLKKDVDKVYTVLRRKFMIPDAELHQRRAEVIASRKERGLDALGQPLKKGLLGKLFG